MRDDSAVDWARETFGGAELGDVRRTQRLVAIAAAAARQPAGKVTQVLAGSAAREGAFRLLENGAVRSERVAEAVFDATARNCADQQLLYVAIDGSSLTLTDRARRRELGRVGPRWPTRGLHVMTTLATDAQGATVGVLEQRWWSRAEKKRPPGKKKRLSKCLGKKYLERETRHWVDSVTLAEQRLRQHAPRSRAWYQLDRGADCWPVLKTAVEQGLLLTLRASQNRRLRKADGSKAYLRDTLKKQPILGHYHIEVPARPDRPARVARIALRACPVTIDALVGNDKRRQTFQLQAVHAEELGYRGNDRIRWILLTTAVAGTFEQARTVVLGYSRRWRVEEFHRTWKRGLCHVEDSQLQSREAIQKWATLLAAVATRALRIAQLLRTSPDLPAGDEFTDYEIEAAFILAKKKRDRRRRVSLAELVDIIADLGGFAHKYSGSLPGPTVLGRGLERIQILAHGLQNMDEMR